MGKTSLVRRYVYQKFSDDYLTTIGVKIDKKVVTVDGTEVSMLIWDIAGETSQDKVPASYKLGAHGILYVFDLTRSTSYENIDEEIRQLQLTLPGIPIFILGNKADLMDASEYEALISGIGMPNISYSSAKTGKNVEETFLALATAMR